MAALLMAVIALATLLPAPGSADISDYLLPNGDPIVGVYYYSWYGGEPYQRVGWTPEFQYNNRTNDAHIHQVIKAMTDYGVNQASYSYWDNGWYLNGLGRHLDHAADLQDHQRHCYFSPYLEPRTIDKQFASTDAQGANADFISTFIGEYGDHPAFCTLGGTPFTNIYVTYYQPDETDDDFRRFLQDKYGAIDALKASWCGRGDYPRQMLAPEDVPDQFRAIDLQTAAQGTAAFADRQQLRAERLKRGWNAVIDRVTDNTGLRTRYTGDVSRTIVSPTDYMDAITGMSWYSFWHPLNNPTRRPKLVSEIAKYTDTTFLYTISPGYVDRQQRWPARRVERTPFLYPYAWTKALQTLPEGIMVLTHSEWFEGSIIDVTKEYGRREYETTEVYSSIFRGAFQSIYDEKRDKEPVAVVFNEWATYSINPGGHALDDVYGLIKLLECLNIDFDVIPETRLSADELRGRRLILVPNCRASLAPGHNEMLLHWARTTPQATLLVDRSNWWANTLGITMTQQAADIPRYRLKSENQWLVPPELGDAARPRHITDPASCAVIGRTDGDAPKLLRKAHGDTGGQTIFFNGQLGQEFLAAFTAAAETGAVPANYCRQYRQFLTTHAPEALAGALPPPHPSFQVNAGPLLQDGDTFLVPAGNVLPWGYITNHRRISSGVGEGHNAEQTKPWQRLDCRFRIPVEADRSIAEVQAIDSDAGRCVDVPFEYDRGVAAFTYPVKFHSVFGIVQSPVRVRTPEFTISPGQASQFTARVRNLTDADVDCTLRMRSVPGLKMQPLDFSLPPAGTDRISIALTAGTDYASGDRTIAFELEADGRTSVFWRRIHATLPAGIGTRTTILAGNAGDRVQRDVTLVNVGQAPARDVQLQLLDATTNAPDLQPGRQATVQVAFTVPHGDTDSRIPDESVGLTLGENMIENGLTTRSIGDGTTKDIEVAGQQATVPTGGLNSAGNRRTMIYLWVDDAILPPANYDLEAVVTYFDRGSGTFMIEYDSVYGDEIEDRYRDSRRVPLMNTDAWRTVRIPLPGARLAGRQNYGADLRINGIVPVASVTLRGLERSTRTLRRTMTVNYSQFGHDMAQDLDLTIISLHGQPASPEGEAIAAAVNPYGDAVSGYFNFSGRARPADAPQLQTRAAAGLHIAQNPYCSAVWDEHRGGLVSICSNVTNADYAAYPGPVIPVYWADADGTGHYAAPGQISAEDNAHISKPLVVDGIDGGQLRITDTWRLAPDTPHIQLQRRISVSGDPQLAEFCPAVLRLDAERFSQTLPLGVGFAEEDGSRRGWLETWHSDGWYFAFSGDPNHATHAVALTVRARTADGDNPLRRFKYGFFPGSDLPPLPRGAIRDTELQIQLLGRKQLTDMADIDLTLDIYLLPGRSYRAARQLALINRTPETIKDAWSFAKDGTALGGVQTILPTPPLYMFDVRQPYYSAALEGEEQ